MKADKHGTTDQRSVALFSNAGSTLALYSREATAEEDGRAAAPRGSIGVALAINLESRELVDEALAAARVPGVRCCVLPEARVEEHTRGGRRSTGLVQE